LLDGDIIKLTTTGTLPTGLSLNTYYYVIKINNNTFNVTDAPGNSAITISSAGSGTHTVTNKDFFSKGYNPFLYLADTGTGLGSIMAYVDNWYYIPLVNGSPNFLSSYYGGPTIKLSYEDNPTLDISSLNTTITPSSIITPQVYTNYLGGTTTSNAVNFNNLWRGSNSGSSTNITDRIVLGANNYVWVARSGGTPLFLQKTDSTGSYAAFYNGSTLGATLAIGTANLFQVNATATLQLSSGTGNLNLDPGTGNHLTGNSIIYTDVSNTGARGLLISNSSGGYLIGTASSTKRVKQQISNFEWDAEAMLKISPKKFKYNSDVENFGENANWAYGLLAEDLDELGLEGLINRDKEGLPDYISYEKIGVALISVVKYQQKTIEDLEKRIALLENK
jgi:hypothetical protein